MHALDKSTGSWAIAYAGQTPWHRHGTAKPVDANWSLDQWIDAANVGYDVIRVPALAQLPDGRTVETGTFFNMRSDTQAILGGQTHTDRRVEVQPREVFQFVHDYVAADDRFQFEVLGALYGGAQVWATARFNGDLSVAGERHQAYLLARTGFDGSLATHLQMTVIRVVCNNTASAAALDKRAAISLRHTAAFDARKAGQQLAAMAQSIATFKQAGDAMATVEMAHSDVAAFYRSLLDIPHEQPVEQIGTRKLNAFNSMRDAYVQSVQEGAGDKTVWAALQGVTRYVDHERTARGDKSETEDYKRFVSSQFGSGTALKAKAMDMLLPRVKELVAA